MGLVFIWYKEDEEEVFINEAQKFEMQWNFPNCNGATGNKQV
jgi:hypothetical protein